jgi:pyruvate/2-oxoglutarate dehydrogenase complex dihydrolipoamide acyltransferase (E2) component
VSSLPTEASAQLVDVTMPQMGVSVAEGTVVAWRVAIGDRVEADETLCEISTDKIDTEVPAPASGVLAEILVEPDQTVAVGTVLARIATGPMVAGAPGPASTPVPGALTAVAGDGGQRANGHAAGEGRRRGRYSPVVARIAAEHGVDLALVPGTGRDGRVRKQDVLAYIAQSPAGAPTNEPPLHIESPYRPEPTVASTSAAPAVGPTLGAPASAPPVRAAQQADTQPPVESGTLSRMRRQIGERMKRSLQTAATCTTWIEADMSAVEAARRRLGVTALAFVARACIDALREHPALNATLEEERYTRYQAVHLGIAVSLGEDGLIVPVIHNAQELAVEGLAARIRELAGRARSGQLSPDEVRGGTFTITNPGQFGSIMATPVINQPQVAILDLEAIVKRPVVVNDAGGGEAIAIRAMTILGLSWDHRALDGAQAAQFLAAVRRNLEAVVP